MIKMLKSMPEVAVKTCFQKKKKKKDFDINHQLTQKRVSVINQSSASVLTSRRLVFKATPARFMNSIPLGQLIKQQKSDLLI